MNKIYLGLALLFSILGMAQSEIVGTVIDANYQPVSGVNIVVEGTNSTETTDFYGVFRISVEKKYPITIIASGSNFESTSITITNKDSPAIITLVELNQLDEIVISASRTPEKVFESPVSIENFGRKEIKNTTSVDFYGGLENIKGVDINTNSVTLKSINTRGFATFANTRFVQLVDGVDNTAPALNIVLGNLIGLTELDVNGIELLPGASSALYGANAFNGILFMKSKSPFDYPGISAYYKSGITSQDAAGDNFFHDYGIRMAKKFSNKFAVKATFSLTRGEDWLAADKNDVTQPGIDRSNPGYDGINVYGDEVGQSLSVVGQSLVNAGLLTPVQANALPNTFVTRTGYEEKDLNNNKFESLKFYTGLHYRPFENDFEILYTGRLGRGTTVTQDANRTSLRNFLLQQHKLEVRNKRFFVRGYITAEDAGDTYDIRFTGININRAWKDDSRWFAEYVMNFLGAVGTVGEEQAHFVARDAADSGRFIPGTIEFSNAFNRITKDADFTKGSRLQEKSEFRHMDANYNFGHLFDHIADMQIGGSFREYKLNSSGRVFTDRDGPIKYSEYGIYFQTQKKILKERLKITGSLRYDKSQLFEGNISPRFSLGYTIGEEKRHNIRASIQTGFRNPTTQDLYLGLDIGGTILSGSAPDNLDRDVRTFPLNIGGVSTISLREAYENSFSLSSVQQQTPVKADIDIVLPEKITVTELGYRGKINRFVLDVSGYYNRYRNFISNENVVVPLYGRVDNISNGDLTALNALQNEDFIVYTTSTNSDVVISSYGIVTGLTGKVFKNFDFGVNYTFTEQDFDRTNEPDFKSNFNTPKHRFKASFGNDNLFKNFGFNTNFRWSDRYFWESNFADGVVPSYSVIDAQINYRISFVKSVLKVGVNNITGNEYYTGIGTGFIGSQYYIGLSINNL